MAAVDALGVAGALMDAAGGAGEGAGAAAAGGGGVAAGVVMTNGMTLSVDEANLAKADFIAHFFNPDVRARCRGGGCTTSRVVRTCLNTRCCAGP